MSQSKSTLDPEVLELLDEIAADPDSTLLRVPREPLRRYFPLREGPVSAREPVLSRAEKYLVCAHREYLARLLFEGCRLALTRDPIERNRIHRWVSEDEPLELPSEDRWRFWASRDIESRSPDDDTTLPRNLLDRCVGVGKPPAASELAGASLRLVPCDETRIWLGVALHREGQSRSALHALQDVLAHRPSPTNEQWARTDCGFVAFGGERYAQAVDWYESAALVQDSAIPVLSWFASALQLGSEAKVSTAQARLDELVDLDDSTLHEIILSLRAITPTTRCKKLLPTVRKKSSPVARSIIDALLQ